MPPDHAIRVGNSYVWIETVGLRTLWVVDRGSGKRGYYTHLTDAIRRESGVSDTQLYALLGRVPTVTAETLRLAVTEYGDARHEQGRNVRQGSRVDDAWTAILRLLGML